MKQTHRLLASLAGFAILLSTPATSAAQSLNIGFGSRYATVRGGVDFGGRAHNGRWVLQRQRVWVPGRQRIVRVPARWGYRYDSCGHRTRVLISPARRRVVREPGHWTWRTSRVWVPGHRPSIRRRYRR